MFTEEREYDYWGKLILKKSKILKEGCQPKDDKINWLFMKVDENLYSFVYKIESPSVAMYEEPFNAAFAFTMSDKVKEIAKMNQAYEVYRGPEPIGKVILKSKIN